MLKELKHYIEKSLKQGHPIGNIKLKLLEVGYSHEQVRGVVSVIKKKKLYILLALVCAAAVSLVLMFVFSG